MGTMFRCGARVRLLVLAAALAALLAPCPSPADAAAAYVYVEARCDDVVTEHIFKRLAMDYLRQIPNVEIAHSMESANAIVSFYEIHPPKSDGEAGLGGRFFYSFAYGLVELDVSGDILTAYPRYMDHMPVICRTSEIARSVRENIAFARDMILLR